MLSAGVTPKQLKQAKNDIRDMALLVEPDYEEEEEEGIFHISPGTKRTVGYTIAAIGCLITFGTIQFGDGFYIITTGPIMFGLGLVATSYRKSKPRAENPISEGFFKSRFGRDR